MLKIHNPARHDVPGYDIVEKGDGDGNRGPKVFMQCIKLILLVIAGRFPVAQENTSSACLLFVDPKHVLRVEIDGEMLGDAVGGIIPEEGCLRKKFKPVQESKGAGESCIALSGC